MIDPRFLHPTDLQGLARLCVRGVSETTDLVEHLHANISLVPSRRDANAEPRTRGITSLVYRSIQAVTGLVGGALDQALGVVVHRVGTLESSRERERALAVLNGVLGDHLEATGNPLAIPMALHAEGAGTPSTTSDGARLAVFVHGLCMDELCWDAPAGSAGLPDAMAAGGWSIARLRYNSGRHVHDNGRELDRLLTDRIAARSGPIQEIALIGHSMGGLVARSAVHQGLENGSDWVGARLRLVSLGTPHLGSPVERFGHRIDRLLGVSRYSAPFARLGRMRSAGITDLRHGNVLTVDAANAHRFQATRNARSPSCLPERTRCYAVAATLDREAGSLRSRHAGDGLVPVPSALGRHDDPALRLPVAPDRTLVVTETGHIELLHHPEVVRRVGDWLA